MTKHNNQAAPRLRFQGFDGAWEERELGDIAEISSGGTPNRKEPLYWNGTIPWVTTSEVDNCLIQTTKEFITQLGLNNSAAKIFPKNTILIAMYGQGKTRGKVGILNIEATTNQACASIILDKQYSYEFIYQALASQYENIRLLSNSGGQDNLSTALIKNILFRLPEKDEQTQLGNFFRQLDERIAQSRALWEKSRQLKKAMLAKMFPAAGETVPQIRFKGFTGAWERKKLGEVVEIVGGGTPDTTNSAYWNGDIDWYSPTEIGENVYANGSVKKITQLGLQKSSATILPANKTVLFTSRASIGDMAILARQGATNQGFQSFVIRNDLDVYFLYAMGFKIKEYALKNASGSTFLEISKNKLLEMEIQIPAPEEQTAIGNFFRQLDDTIALQALETEKLGYLKKALLAAMLV